MFTFKKIQGRGDYISDGETFGLYDESGDHLGDFIMTWPRLYLTFPPNKQMDHYHLEMIFSAPRTYKEGKLIEHYVQRGGECSVIWEAY